MTTDDFTLPIKAGLPQTAADKFQNKNTLNSYIPIRTQGNDFDWSSVVGLVLRGLLRKKIEKYNYLEFTADCKANLQSKLGEEDFWDVLEDMYFTNQDIFSVSPEFLLFKSQKSECKAGDLRVASLFINLLNGRQIEQFDANLNFIEQELLETLRSKTKPDTDKSLCASEAPYLPYMAEAFKRDLEFLTTHPKYLLDEFEQFLAFYGFAYTAQLSLSLSDWKNGQAPTAKPLYFIMDHERASNERIHVKKHGYKLFSESSFKLFPILSMLENLQPSPDKMKKPLWQLARDIENSKRSDLAEQIKNYALMFRANRKLDTEIPGDAVTAIDWLEYALKLAEEQFRDPKTDRPGTIKKYIKAVEDYMATDFVQARGRSGRVLVLTQDHVILLTNLVVGKEEKLRFHELTLGFQERGIFVDKQTEQELIKFYERIGNVERMSDSGDAVYVRKTI
ncbi:DNA phosphorothioation-dependent restriction protein DptG [Vibrio fluvialis]|jgi:DNA phosphorothioation-dependent restriction protein DptG|uniref:DNA phosphorothioation-dependent restriction protein DptG n=1 Tax=Vibrio cholerae TaxID=666 RepID=UPI0004E361E4|nr:DNA phosphorothioation-dependent restriction protein DptG [Vibrio cholerae]EKO3406800.1 DNA phosphorothioation-dependent restriction protein DptG [Vibrio fluvialis]EGR1107451.1 DNA phosphorothioation-dependent restriction protein DptG [Vibrio cholerae]ELP2650591.1 DNA phosphorothioation-dependent restriction protein DptG [Vibrio fluvialis]KFE12318.1 DNA phosphorothioation-dependent restriction protein DptG [Vibrio cholerae]GIB76486.1 DNA phosphorothioation-dependent restriction protein DptG